MQQAKPQHRATHDPFMQRSASSTQTEDIFVDLFREVFGLEKAQKLVHEFPYRDFLGNHRFVDSPRYTYSAIGSRFPNGKAARAF
jgi:hypothetical protein